MARKETKNIVVRPPKALAAEVGIKANGSQVRPRDWQHAEKLIANRAAVGIATDADKRFAGNLRGGR
jgi:hypothetical protein